ncbi:MAG: deoxyguanosinetriphosphate triphosphohydrolase [Anaerolineae bacterium]|nr:deoxyguanosinetriphosphate triphosphohydrolase [Anaerolineae bacterium]
MIYTRQQLESLEKFNLASYACFSAESRGRAFPEEEAQHRTCFQRDRDRILHSTAFRRLEYKTQVFINYEGDHYRTRLTHTLEVAQIARSIATALGVNVDLTEAICLVHDIGHPPFGHAGERVLNELMAEYGGFEHNRQSYRVVTLLEKRYPQFAGLNLTHETLEGIISHKTSQEQVTTGTEGSPNGHLEAQIADIADALAYTAHDLDDGLRSGMLTPQMLAGLTLWQIATNGVVADSCSQLTDLQRHQVVRTLIGTEIQQLITHTDTLLKKNDIRTIDDVRRLPYNLVSLDEHYLAYHHELKSFLYQFLYYQYRVMRMTFKAEKVINELFYSYCDHPEILPPHIFDRIRDTEKERTICDYIAGMTDRFAIEEHQKIYNPTVMP